MYDISFAKKIHRRINVFPWIPSRDLYRFGKIWTILKAKPYTMNDYPRLADVYDLISEVEGKNNLEGAIVECGSWNGGCSRVMNEVSEKYGKKRNVWIFDSFEGLPDSLPIDKKPTGKQAYKGSNKADKEICETALKNVGKDRLHIVQGWFKDTLPLSVEKVGPIAFLHLDADLYESTTQCLENLYDLVVPGGLIFIDDYGYYQGCKKAVDEFLTSRNHAGLLTHYGQDSMYLRKPNT